MARDIKVDGREAPIRAATVRERMPTTESANAPSRSRLCLAVWCTPGFFRLTGIWAISHFHVARPHATNSTEARHSIIKLMLGFRGMNIRAVLSTVLLFQAAAHAQSLGGTITGVVTDAAYQPI